VLGLGILTLLVVTAGIILYGGTGQKRVTAYFTQTPGLYAGDAVKVLGVKVGTVESISAERDQVKVEMTYDAKVTLPAEVKAAVMAPKLVTGRFIQLAPAYNGGPKLADDVALGLDRTAIPIEWDQVKDQLTTLAQQLGPKASNPQGAVKQLLETSSANLAGQGGNIRESIRQLARALGTISDGRQDLFGTVRNLQIVVNTLAESDSQVGQFNRQLSQVANVLKANRDELGLVLRTFNQTAPTIERFVADNKDQLNADMHRLDRVTSNLSNNRQAVADLLNRAPNALSNLQNIYSPVSKKLTAALALTNMNDPAGFICSSIFSLGGTFDDCRTGIGPLAQLLRLNNIPVPLDATKAPGNGYNPEPGAPPPSLPLLFSGGSR
jgi:phospholipid/cholesterol/gamma-HCH transport system substrate-binding protein